MLENPDKLEKPGVRINGLDCSTMRDQDSQTRIMAVNNCTSPDDTSGIFSNIAGTFGHFKHETETIIK